MRRRILAWLAVLAFAAGCSRFQVRSDYDPQASFSGLRTYAWMSGAPAPTRDPRIDGTLLDSRIRGAVERHLAAKGYQQLKTGTPSFLVTYQVFLQRKTDVVMTGGAYSYRWWGMAQTQTYQYDEGTLVLDLINPETNQVIWRGSASAVIDRDASPEKREERIDAAVGEILKKFPPQ